MEQSRRERPSQASASAPTPRTRFKRASVQRGPHPWGPGPWLTPEFHGGRGFRWTWVLHRHSARSLPGTPLKRPCSQRPLGAGPRGSRARALLPSPGPGKGSAGSPTGKARMCMREHTLPAMCLGPRSRDTGVCAPPTHQHPLPRGSGWAPMGCPIAGKPAQKHHVPEGGGSWDTGCEPPHP